MEDKKDKEESLKKESKTGVKRVEESKPEEKKDEEKKKRKCWWIIPIIIIAILVLLFFLLKFKVTFKYNNGEEAQEVDVKVLRKIAKDSVREDLVNPGKAFLGYFETYYLSGEQIEKIKNDKSLEETICKAKFKLNSEKDKCVAEDKFPFDTKRIIKKTTIEALWSSINFAINPTEKTIYVGDGFKITATISGTDNKTVTWKSNDTGIATVDNDGNVKGVKVGKTTIVAESNGLKRECTVTVSEKPVAQPKVSLTATGQCLVGTSSVTAKAAIANDKGSTITWTYPKCFAHEINETEKSVKLYRTMVCSDSEETKPVITAKLNNGSTASLTFTYEPKLVVKVYSNSTQVFPNGDGAYEGGNGMRIETNVNATFSGQNISSTTATSARVSASHDPVITIKTPCGQTKSIQLQLIIN